MRRRVHRRPGRRLGDLRAHGARQGVRGLGARAYLLHRHPRPARPAVRRPAGVPAALLPPLRHLRQHGERSDHVHAERRSLQRGRSEEADARRLPLARQARHLHPARRGGRPDRLRSGARREVVPALEFLVQDDRRPRKGVRHRELRQPHELLDRLRFRFRSRGRHGRRRQDPGSPAGSNYEISWRFSPLPETRVGKRVTV